MIFVTVGSQKFQFNRLLEEIDRLIYKKKIKSNEVFAQVGYSTYKPKFYTYKEFLDKDEFTKKIDTSDIIITHGGTGSIITSIKKGKKVIGIPRSAKYGEHVDNHQFEIIEQFSNSNFIYSVTDIKKLECAIDRVKDVEFRKYNSNTYNFIKLIDRYLAEI